MRSSADEAILMLKKWESSSSRLRMVFGSDHARMTLHGKVRSAATESVCCIADDDKDELTFDLSGNAIISFIGSSGLPEGFEDLDGVVDEVISVVWPDRTSLILLTEPIVDKSEKERQ